jgi:hypothetical protein
MLIRKILCPYTKLKLGLPSYGKYGTGFVFEDRVLRRMSGPKGRLVEGRWLELGKAELRDQNIIRFTELSMF